MPDGLAERLRALVDPSNLRDKLHLLIALACLFAAWAIIRRFTNWLGRPHRRKLVEPELLIDTSLLPLPHDESTMSISVYNVPVRLAAVVIAPLGRDSATPSDDQAEWVLNAAVPGLGEAFLNDTPVLRVWPRQLSATGFANSLARNVPLPGARGKRSPWCLVAGRATIGSQSFMIGLAMVAIGPNNLGLINIESDHQWLDVVRMRR